MPRAPHAPMFVREMGLSARFALYALGSLVLMGVDARHDGLAQLRHSASTLITPVQSALARPFGFFSDALAFFQTHGVLLQQNQGLERERQRLLARQQDYARLRAENQHLRELLALPPRPGVRAISAEIVHAVPDPFSRKLTLNRGRAEGVEAGRPVVDAQGLVGQITESHDHASTLTLLTSREQSVPVLVERNGLRLVVTGAGNDNLLEVRFLDVNVDVRAGDLLHTSGIDGVYPAGIPVARVVRVEAQSNSPFLHAVCTPLALPQRHLQLSVLLRQAPGPTPLPQPVAGP